MEEMKEDFSNVEDKFNKIEANSEMKIEEN